MKKETKWLEVCDLPYCDEPEELYHKRVVIEKMRIEELREKANQLLKKSLESLTKKDYLITEIWLFGYPVEGKHNTYWVGYKKYNEEYILSCNCPAWIFNHNKNRTCKHTKLLAGQFEISEKLY